MSTAAYTCTETRRVIAACDAARSQNRKSTGQGDRLDPCDAIRPTNVGIEFTIYGIIDGWLTTTSTAWGTPASSS